MRDKLVVGVVALWAAGCSVGEAAFPKALASAYCGVFEECEKTAFSMAYSSIKDCIDTEASFLGPEQFAGCVYDPKAAKLCIDATNAAKKTCPSSSPAVCATVYTCIGGFDTF